MLKTDITFSFLSFKWLDCCVCATGLSPTNLTLFWASQIPNQTKRVRQTISLSTFTPFAAFRVMLSQKPSHRHVFVLTIKECTVLSFGESYDRCSRCSARSENLGNPTFDENDPEIFGKDTEKNLYLCLENLCARNNRKNIYSVYGKTI